MFHSLDSQSGECLPWDVTPGARCLLISWFVTQAGSWRLRPTPVQVLLPCDCADLLFGNTPRALHSENGAHKRCTHTNSQPALGVSPAESLVEASPLCAWSCPASLELVVRTKFQKTGDSISFVSGVDRGMH